MAKPTASELDRHLGLRLKRLRQQEGLSAAALAEMIGSTQQQISRYENGQNKISAAQLYLLAQRFSVPLSWFFLDSETVTGPLAVREQPPTYGVKSHGVEGYGTDNYGKSTAADDTATLQAIWSRLSPVQRNATLKLLDTFTQP